MWETCDGGQGESAQFHHVRTAHSGCQRLISHTFFTLSCSRLLLISQTDVTVRAQLEEAMARLTATQLSMLCQV